ncbi:MAG: LarC family nickel insertion protein [Cyanobacteriota bacterium]|nr:LarC family nickel insertion protein [Cyanobacteriota bacterium]
MSAIALLDCPTGLAGNMLLGAVLDLGVPQAVIEAPLAALGLAGAYRLQVEERHSAGLRGLHVQVEGLESEPPHRHWSTLQQQLRQAPWPAPLQQRVLAVFGLLAEAEAAVHGIAPEQVHFHEVGAIDALVDVVGVCAGLQHLGLAALHCTPPPAGHGTVISAHGPLPLPAPAVLELARRCAIPLASAAGFAPGELTTPTGLALAACWADTFAPLPSVLPRQLGVGLGSRSLDRANLLRLVIGDRFEPGEAAAPSSAARLETVLVQQAQIDDATAEDLAHLAHLLRQGGALEVMLQPLSLKKGRQGHGITVIAWPQQAEALRQLWWQHSTPLGVRESLQQRWALQRRQIQLATPLGPVWIKQALLPDGSWRSKIEHDDLVSLAQQQGMSLAQVRVVVEAAVEAARQHQGEPDAEA